jgi:predicted DNA-binding transcriptional regulator AlpA
VKTVFWLFGQFESATLTIDQVAKLVDKAPQTIRNRVSAGTFPRPTADGVWLIEDVAAYIDSTRVAPAAPKAA